MATRAAVTVTLLYKRGRVGYSGFCAIAAVTSKE